MITPGSPETIAYVHTDGHGSVIAVTDAAGTVTERHAYGPYGEWDNNGGGGIAYRYAGMRLDAETGLYYARARYYSAAQGRFLQPDPIGLKGGNNLYNYTSNDPVNNVDPNGTDDSSDDDLIKHEGGGFSGGGFSGGDSSGSVVQEPLYVTANRDTASPASGYSSPAGNESGGGGGPGENSPPAMEVITVTADKPKDPPPTPQPIIVPPTFTPPPAVPLPQNNDGRGGNGERQPKTCSNGHSGVSVSISGFLVVGGTIFGGVQFNTGGNFLSHFFGGGGFGYGVAAGLSVGYVNSVKPGPSTNYEGDFGVAGVGIDNEFNVTPSKGIGPGVELGFDTSHTVTVSGCHN